jgi:hypothetical protein
MKERNNETVAFLVQLDLKKMEWDLCKAFNEKSHSHKPQQKFGTRFQRN